MNFGKTIENFFNSPVKNAENNAEIKKTAIDNMFKRLSKKSGSELESALNVNADYEGDIIGITENN